ncbi:retrovirus-related pol polyprotein from transposon TNT 1-94 [Tanacetum coccineum]
MCDGSVNVKPHQTKRFKRQPKKEWKPIRKPVANSKPQWKPTGRHFSLFEKYPLTRIMESTDQPIELPPSASSSPQITMVSKFTDHKLSDRKAGSKGISDSGCSRHMTGDRARLINFVEKFIGTVRFGNDEYATIVGYGDYKLGDTIIFRVYYVEGLKHNLFSVGQFCDGGSRTTNLYSISLNDMMSASPVCLLTKASSTKSWLWHRRLNHLNFGTLNELARKNLVRGLPMLKYDKDHLCPSCQLGKSKKASHPLKTENTNTEVLHTLHMDLCGPMRTESINGKKNETPQVIEKFIGRRLKEPLMQLFASSEQIMERTPLFSYGLEAVVTACQRQAPLSALVKRPEPPSVPPTKETECQCSPSTTVIYKGRSYPPHNPPPPPKLRKALPHQIPLPDTCDSDDETLFDHVDSNVFDTYNAPETDSEASSSNSE